MGKAIPVAMALTIGVSTFGVESAWIPHIVKRIDFVNAPNGSSSSQDSKPSSANNNANPTTSRAAASPTSKNSTPSSQSPANFSNAASKSAPNSSASNSAPVKSNSADSTISGSSTSPLASSTASSSATNSIASSSSSESAVADQNSSKSTSSSGAIGAVVAMAIIIVIGAVAYLIVRRKKVKQNQVKMVEKSDPFTMGYGNHDPLPYKEMNTASMTHNTYPTNEAYTNEANSIPSTQMGSTANVASDSIATYSQPLQSASTASMNYNTNPASTMSAFSQLQLSAVPAAFDGNTAPIATPLPQNNSQNIYAVVATYIPTLSDELEIEMGDQIDLEAEFDDGWCQGKNITKGGTAGVFPRHCIDRVASTNNQVAGVERTKRISSIRIQ
ncbi:hypothetical protein K501DRAFT_228264 [Backusella circina FSU 941]|nr:hypothetical protein K501DRAFT_228264 [Backusella circina FSU 941]